MTPSPFKKYSDDQWQAVVAAIPAAQLADVVDLDSIRGQIEAIVTDFFIMSHSHRERFTDGSKAKVTLKARDNIKAALAFAERTNNAPLQTSLKAALEIVNKTTDAEAYDMLRQAHGRNNDPTRALLYYRLLSVWTAELRGPLTTARSAGRAKTSPAIRFLVAALAPIEVLKIKPDTAAKIVEAERKRRINTVMRRAADTVDLKKP